MSEIVLNEKQWAEDALENLEIGVKPSETLGRLARYYYQQGYKKNEIPALLEQFLLRCDPSINIVRWQGVIDARAKTADKYQLINLTGIDITAEEVKKIKELPGVLLQRLMFTLLCLAKYGNAVFSRNNGWVNREAREIFAMANIVLTIKRQSLLINDLWRAGYIGFSNIVDNVNVNVKIIDNESPAVLRITDFRNLGNQYMMYTGGSYIMCENCGAVIKRVTNNQRYCRDCSVIMNSHKTMDRAHAEMLKSELFDSEAS